MLFKWTPEKVFTVFHSYELSSFGWLQKGSVQEVLTFVSKEVAKRSNPGERQTVANQEHYAHIIVRPDQLACVVVSDQEYPARVAFSLILSAFDEFLKVNPEEWKRAEKDTTVSVPPIDKLLLEYQDPSKADKIMQIQKDLDETKGVLIKSIDQLLERGEKLETLAQRSEDLSLSTKQFVSRSKELNSCCLIL
eukprot:TRINITY_DN1505_c0_g1_i2.p1 TRINITY_DN1505_c0_g1~~TRINITY_DN1505_c0_g1_i2.p1  ORF type:complete len:193 (+),score=25.85 TRINITY_DN1505_c0_g1_i2:161-739(+)